MPDFYDFSVAVLRFLLRLLTRWRVNGKENMPGQEAVLIVANHINLIDPVLIGVSFDRKIAFMAKEELFRSRFLGRLLRSYNVFPVYRGKLDRGAIRQAKQALASGRPLLMFPEGMRSRNAQLQAALSGPALIASRNGAPIIPVGVFGTERIKGAAWLLRRPELIVNIGCPFYLPPVNGRLSKEKLAELTDSIMLHIAELLPLEYRGNYAQRNGD